MLIILLYESYKENENIFQYGFPPKNFYILLKGRVTITITIKDGDKKRIIKKDYRNNDFFGENEIIFSASRISSAIAITPCDLQSYQIEISLI